MSVEGESEVARILNDLAVIGSYLTLVGATTYHAVVLLPAYRLLELHSRLILVVSVLIVVVSLWRVLSRVRWATTWG